MSAELVVPDASVLLKWALESDREPDRDRALALRDAWLADECLIVLPTLWAYEVGNVLGRKAPSMAATLLRLLLDYRFDEVPVGEVFQRALTLMTRLRVTFYDAVYHAVALERKGTLVTADARYAARAAGIGRVTTLSRWAL